MNQDTSTPFQHLPINQVVASKTNRKRFDEAKLQELANNISQHGVMQPILVRPIAGKKPTFEIVAGERRWRASQMAGQENIPAIVRELEDVEALQLQVFENLHREDLHPMEEAEGFSQLLKKSQDLVGYTADELAAKVGKSRAYIYASLKLCDLCEEARQAFFDGKLHKETAILVARIPGKKLQMQAIEEITHDGQQLSFRRAAEVIRNNYTLKLSTAPFNTEDAFILIGAGKCSECPKRSGNCAELYPDIDSPDVCTDPTCFADKRRNHLHKVAENGTHVILGKEARKILPHRGNYVNSDSDYIKTTDWHPQAKGYEPIDKLLGASLPDKILIEHPDTGDIVEVVKKSEVTKALKEKGLLKVNGKSDEERQRESDAKKERAYRISLHDAIRAKQSAAFEVSEFSKDEISIIAQAFWQRTDFETSKQIVKLWWPDRAKGAMHDETHEFGRGVANLSTKEQLMLIMDMALTGQRQCDSYSFDRHPPERLQAMAVSYKIDKDEIRYQFFPETRQANQVESAPSPSTAAHAGDSNALPEVPEAFAEIREKTLARRARRGKKESADADAVVAANAAREAVAA